MALEISDFDTAIHTNFDIETDRGRWSINNLFPTK